MDGGAKIGDRRDGGLHRQKLKGREALSCLTECRPVWKNGKKEVAVNEHVCLGWGFHGRICTPSLHLWSEVTHEKSLCFRIEFIHACTPTCIYVHVCDFCVCVRVCVMHLQTEGTHVPVHAEGGVQAVGLPPQQTTPPHATPGCPQYLKIESRNKGVKQM